MKYDSNYLSEIPSEMWMDRARNFVTKDGRKYESVTFLLN